MDQLGWGAAHPQLAVFCAILVAALSGAVFSMLLAFASVHLKANQTIGGTALNMLAPAFAIVLTWAIQGAGADDHRHPQVGAHHQRGFAGGVLQPPDLQEPLFDHAHRHTAAHRLGHHPLQNAAGAAPALLRRASAGGGQRGHQRIQDALHRRVHLRHAGRHRRPGLYGGLRLRLQSRWRATASSRWR